MNVRVNFLTTARNQSTNILVSFQYSTRAGRSTEAPKKQPILLADVQTARQVGMGITSVQNAILCSWLPGIL